MSTVLRAVLTCLVVLISDTQCASWKYSCPTGWTYYSGSCTLIMEKQTWASAQGFCEMLGANLVIISDSKENKHVHELVTQASILDSDLWIGLHDQVAEGHFVWVKSNREARWSHWAQDQPDDWRGAEDCGTIRRNGTWNDRPCTDHSKFLCELYL